MHFVHPPSESNSKSEFHTCIATQQMQGNIKALSPRPIFPEEISECSINKQKMCSILGRLPTIFIGKKHGIRSKQAEQMFEQL